MKISIKAENTIGKTGSSSEIIIPRKYSREKTRNMNPKTVLKMKARLLYVSIYISFKYCRNSIFVWNLIVIILCSEELYQSYSISKYCLSFILNFLCL